MQLNVLIKSNKLIIFLIILTFLIGCTIPEYQVKAVCEQYCLGEPESGMSGLFGSYYSCYHSKNNRTKIPASHGQIWCSP